MKRSSRVVIIGRSDRKGTHLSRHNYNNNAQIYHATHDNTKKPQATQTIIQQSPNSFFQEMHEEKRISEEEWWGARRRMLAIGRLNTKENDEWISLQIQIYILALYYESIN